MYLCNSCERNEILIDISFIVSNTSVLFWTLSRDLFVSLWNPKFAESAEIEILSIQIASFVEFSL